MGRNDILHAVHSASVLTLNTVLHKVHSASVLTSLTEFRTVLSTSVFTSPTVIRASVLASSIQCTVHCTVLLTSRRPTLQNMTKMLIAKSASKHCLKITDERMPVSYLNNWALFCKTVLPCSYRSGCFISLIWHLAYHVLISLNIFIPKKFGISQ